MESGLESGPIGRRSGTGQPMVEKPVSEGGSGMKAQTLSARMDDALDAKPNSKRTLIFFILAGGWWVPDAAYRT